MRHRVVLTGTKSAPLEDTPQTANDRLIASLAEPTASLELEMEYDEGAQEEARELLLEMLVQMRYHLGDCEAYRGEQDDLAEVEESADPGQMEGTAG